MPSSDMPDEERAAWEQEKARREEEEARARWEAEQAAEPQIARSIIGTDDRYAPDNINDPLWRPVCAIFFNYPGERGGRLGSGVLIGQRLVLTAAHNLFDMKTRQPIMGGDVRVGVKNGKHAASSPISAVQVLKNYKKQNSANAKKYNYDYGVILLQNDAVNNWAGSVWSLDGMTPFATRALKNAELIVAGYPAEDGVGGTELKLSKGPAEAVVKKTFAYKMDTTAGQSGGPVFEYSASDGVVTLAGVHVAGLAKKEISPNALMRPRKNRSRLGPAGS